MEVVNKQRFLKFCGHLKFKIVFTAATKNKHNLKTIYLSGAAEWGVCFLKNIFLLVLERGREKNIDQLPPTRPLLGIDPATPVVPWPGIEHATFCDSPQPTATLARAEWRVLKFLSIFKAPTCFSILSKKTLRIGH